MTNEQLKQLCDQVKQRAQDLQNPNLESWLDEVRGYLDVGQSLGRSINFEKPNTIRRAQKALALMEARLDRIMVLQHDAKRVLQIIASVEYQLVGAFVRAKKLSEKTTGPAQLRVLTAAVPQLLHVKISWETLEYVCAQAQKRIASAKDAIKLQSQLDDNLRWAQFRNPG